MGLRSVSRCAAAVLALTIGLPSPLWAADVEITTSTSNGFVLDSFSGTTANIHAGVTLSNTTFNASCPQIPGFGVVGLCASTKAWTVTNNGTIGPAPFGDAVHFIAGGSITNAGTIEMGVNGLNGIWIEGGPATVDNLVNATISGWTGAIVIGKSTNPTGGTVTNAGTITSLGQAIGIAGNGTVTNYVGGLIEGHGTNSNAVSFIVGASHILVNSGTIKNNDGGFAAGVGIDNGTVTNNIGGQILGAYNGVWANGSGATSVANHGYIEASKAQSNGAAVEFDAGGSLTNDGTITSLTSNSTTTDSGVLFSGAGSITNSGTIQSTTGGLAIKFSGSATHTLNLDTGSVLGGNVQGGTGTDNLVLKGTGSESAGKFTGFETLSMQGTDWTLSSNGTFSTSASVTGGKLHVNGNLTTPTLTVSNGAVIAGNGSVLGSVTINGTVAPGNSIGVLTMASATFNAGSSFEVEIDPASADKLVVTGTATIDPTANVSVLAAPGTYVDGSSYLILSAGTRTGAFGGVIDNSAFLDFTLDQTIVNQVWLRIATVADFASVAETPNQRAAAGGLQSLGSGPLFSAVAMLDAASARRAFDLTSGEIHPTIKGAILDDSRFVRDAVLERLDERFEAAFAPAPLAYADAPSMPAISPGPRTAFWGKGFGSWGSYAGDGNAAAFGRTIGGFIAGVDASTDALRFGLAGGYQTSVINVGDRASSATVDGYSFVGYGGFDHGAMAFHFGAAATAHTIATMRQVDFAGVSQTLTARYGALSGQVFGEAAYRARLGGINVEPFANIVHVAVATDAFSESGGSAALSAARQGGAITLANFGARFDTTLPVGNGAVTLRGMVAWQHAFGDVTPRTSLAFAGGAPFTVAGVPIARDALRLEAGAEWRMSESASIGIAYSGVIASGVQDHGVQARFTLRF